MILRAFLLALGDLTRPGVRGTIGLAVLLSLALLAGAYAALVAFLLWLTPETLTLPFGIAVSNVHALLTSGSALVFAVLSIFLMAPVSAVFAGLFVERVAEAVEQVHYPALPPSRSPGLAEGLVTGLRFSLVLLGVNAVALVVTLLLPFALPVVFWLVNGVMLGREYFLTVAQRRLPPAEALALYRAERPRLWLAGALMAAPLALPLVAVVIPALGAATFTHLFHALRAGRQAY